MAEPLLAVSNLSHHFGGLLAVDGVSIAADEGRITGLIGPNGAGKTTLFGLISGFIPPNQGDIRYGGESIARLPTHERARVGIARTFQIVQPFAGLTVRENIVVGAHLRHRSRADALAAADVVGREVGLGGVLDRPADTLTVAGRKRLELARALATEPRLLLLDEALAGLNPTEIREIVPVIRKLCDRGITIMMIEHVMQAVMSLSEHIFVLAEGRIIAEGAPAQVAADRGVIEAYLGHGAAKKFGAQA
jgi:branched-chain amino acid transport system ATP-binding protein